MGLGDIPGTKYMYPPRRIKCGDTSISMTDTELIWRIAGGSGDELDIDNWKASTDLLDRHR